MAYRTESDGGVTILWPDGRQDRFYALGGGVFQPPVGVYDQLARPSADVYRLTSPDGTVYYFDSGRHRRVTRIEAQDGLALTLAYDAGGQLTAVTDAYGRRLDLAYAGAPARLASVTNAFTGEGIGLTYNALGYLETVTDAGGGVTSFSYERRMARVCRAGSCSVQTYYPDFAQKSGGTKSRFAL